MKMIDEPTFMLGLYKKISQNLCERLEKNHGIRITEDAAEKCLGTIYNAIDFVFDSNIRGLTLDGTLYPIPNSIKFEFIMDCIEGYASVYFSKKLGVLEKTYRFYKERGVDI